MADGGTIHDAVTIRAPRERVFAALTDPTELANWMATDAESDARSGGAFRYVFEFGDASQNNEQAGEYIAVDADRRLVLPWTFPFADAPTTVTYELADTDEGTEVRFMHAGFADGEPWDTARERFTGGWRMFLEALREWVEAGVPSHPLGIRNKAPRS
jgi:uncharacterized protein YndB with AHSA1/START domain